MTEHEPRFVAGVIHALPLSIAFWLIVALILRGIL